MTFSSFMLLIDKYSYQKRDPVANAPNDNRESKHYKSNI